MPRAGHDASGGDGRKRYAAVVEKGENAWKREWSSFMSGVSLKRLRDGSSGVALKASADIERQLATSMADTDHDEASLQHKHAAKGGKKPSSRQAAAETEAVNSDGIPLSAAASSASFSYLFSSPAERRAEREARERQEKEKRQAKQREMMAKKDPLSVMSKHQRALYDATQRGLQLEGMNRKARRDFLHLTVSEEQKKAEAQSREFKLHDLMDDKLAWYQQGPHPVDLIAEKLVRRKAEKKAKQLGLRYNYLAPHASWLAKRAQRRRESLLVGLGKRLIFDSENEAAGTTTVTDPLHHRTVPLRDMGLLLLKSAADTNTAAAAAHGRDDEADTDAAVEAAMGDADEHSGDEAVTEHTKLGGKQKHDEDDNDDDDKGAEAEAEEEQGQPTVTTAPARLPDVGVLQDPSRIATSFVRRVVRDRATAVAIQQLNRTTTFLSSGLVKGPSLLPEDTAAAKGLPIQAFVRPDGAPLTSSASMLPSSCLTAPAAASTAQAARKRPTRASAMPSFSPLPSFSAEADAEAEDDDEREQPTPVHSAHSSAPPVRASRVRLADSSSSDDDHQGEEEYDSPRNEKTAKAVKAVKGLKKATKKVSAVALKQKEKKAKKGSTKRGKES